MRRPPVLLYLAALVGLAGAAHASEPACRPALTFKDVRLSPMRAPGLERAWTAVVSIDASRCAANSTGHYEIVLTRVKENAPDLEFRERFVWSPPTVQAAVDLAADEAVGRYSIDNITPCRCRD
jgi:hypothetical protein